MNIRIVPDVAQPRRLTDDDNKALVNKSLEVLKEELTVGAKVTATMR